MNKRNPAKRCFAGLNLLVNLQPSNLVAFLNFGRRTDMCGEGSPGDAAEDFCLFPL